MDQPIQPKPPKPRIRIRVLPNGDVRYEVYENGELVLLGLPHQLPEVYQIAVDWFCQGELNAA